ncbi:MAG: hypothetical protein IBJ03_10335 [Gemmatimonadaceae bacterium]|nr:hypothetical protein [Gemmatimonadaceae bacterium]
MTRLRRAAMLMLVLQIVQIGVLAASPVCEVMRSEANASVVAHGSHTSHGAQHGAEHGMQHHAQHETATPDPTHGDHAECPMAMLCAVTAIAGQAPTVRIVESHLAENVPAYAPTAPLSAWRAPETPPPRA